MKWGILGPGKTAGNRRVRTLNLTVATRDFNERAVPGLGGVWFGRQVYLATLGVRVARQANRMGSTASPIAVTNAIEALACWLTLQAERSGESAQGLRGRVRGREKLPDKTALDMVYSKVSRSGFYVTQPMRMATVNALPALGLVEAEGSRFNGFACSEAGLNFVDAMIDDARPHKTAAVDYLVDWVLGKNRGRIDRSAALQKVLKLQEPMPSHAAALLEAALTHNAPGRAQDEDARRRRDALAWVRFLRRHPAEVSWDRQPDGIRSTEHWNDLRAGAAFFLMRDAAIETLDTLETQIGTTQGRFALEGMLPAHIGTVVEALRKRAAAFREQARSIKDPEREAMRFSAEMIDADPLVVLRRLVERDDRVLRLEGFHVRPGPAFQGGTSLPRSDADNEDAAQSGNAEADHTDLGFPEGISGRIRNLWLLALDLDDRFAEKHVRDAEAPALEAA